MEYIASFSGGKDSAATIILAKEHGEPLNEIIFSEVIIGDVWNTRNRTSIHEIEENLFWQDAQMTVFDFL